MKALLSAVALLSLSAAPVCAQDTLALTSIEQRLRRAEDELAIRRVLIDYAWTQDARDFPAYAALFAREGEWINGANAYRGREAILQMLTGIYGEPDPDYVNRESLHITSNIEIDLAGDRATARSRHLLILRGPEGAPQPALAGRYEDELIREDGEWKILRRVDYPVMPTPEEWGAFMRARQAGQ